MFVPDEVVGLEFEVTVVSNGFVVTLKNPNATNKFEARYTLAFANNADLSAWIENLVYHPDKAFL